MSRFGIRPFTGAPGAMLFWAVVAVAARLALAWACANAGVFADMAQYHERAVHLAETGTLFPDALRGPGYPALLALVYRLFGISFWSARLANAAVGGVLTLVTGWLAARAGAGPRAWVASAIVALYPGLVLSSVYVMPEGLFALLSVLTLLLMRHRSLAMAGGAGVTAGTAILTRSVGVTLLVTATVLAVWRAATDGKGASGPHRGAPLGVASSGRSTAWPTALARLAVFVVTCGLVLAPWLTFTTRVAGGPLLDSTSGMNVLLGNHDGATGRLDMADDAPLRQAHVAGATSDANGNGRALRAGVVWAATHPGASLRLAVLKVAYLLGLEGREHVWVYSVGYFGPRLPATVTLWGVLLLVSFPLLVAAALVGVVRASGPLQPVHVALGTFVLATCALHVASFGESRFHLPLVPVLAVAASLGGATGRPRVPDGTARVSRRRLAAATVIVALLGVAWVSQAPELLEALTALRQPNGWSTPRPY